jgi:hypothetical protein
VMYGGYSLLDLMVRKNPFLTSFREHYFLLLTCEEH